VTGLAVAMAAMTLAGCTSTVAGTAAPGASSGPAASTTAGPTTAPTTTGETASGGSDQIAGPGECVVGDDPAPVACEESHTVEITTAGTFDATMPEDPPKRDAVFASVFPQCRTAAARYLGSDDYDMTTLAAWVLWPGEDEWRQGGRWYRCGVVQLASDGQARPRTGSVADALAHRGADKFRLCSTALPSREMPHPTGCDKPHRSEAIAVIPMGEPSDPLPTDKEFEAAARPKCADALTSYLGATREDVFVSWRWPDKRNWRHGFNNLTCYAETRTSITGTLRGIGSKPLPR
jgi:hypothetical protein